VRDHEFQLSLDNIVRLSLKKKKKGSRRLSLCRGKKNRLLHVVQTWSDGWGKKRE
jgi:hypothetical protein